MLQIDLNERATWRFALDTRDANGDRPNLEGVSAEFRMFTLGMTAIAMATTASGTITAGLGDEDTGNYYRLTIRLPYADHSTFEVGSEWENILGDLYLWEDADWTWSGRQQFRVFRSADFTGATGA